MHSNNHYFGHARILADAGGEQDVPPIWGVLQHGWQRGTGFPPAQRFLPGMAKLAWAEHNRREAAQAGLSSTVAIGAPMLYLRDRLARVAKRSEGQGTLVYPFHRWGDIDASHGELIRAVRDREVGPVTVCLFHLEYEDLPVRRAYEDAGFRVICHGHRLDPSFLYRQAEELLRHSRVVANRESSALWYGGAFGREIEIYGPVFSIPGSDTVGEVVARQRALWPELSSGGLSAEAARRAADEELGAESVRDAEELRQILGWTGFRRTLGPVVAAGARAAAAVVKPSGGVEPRPSRTTG